MTAKQEQFEYQMVCDAARCGVVFTGDLDDGWRKFIDGAKADGWTIRSVGPNEWEHYCPNCGIPK